MRVLIVGGTGLISTAITRMLVERGDDVIIYNRGTREAEVPEGVQVIHGDRREYAAFETQMAEWVPIDAVIDMVCFVPADAQSAIRAFGGWVDQYIFCSTVDVYTKPPTEYPIREDQERKPSEAFPYAFNKAACEEVLMSAHEAGTLPVTIIRPAHTYGEGGNVLHSLGWGTYYVDRLRRGLPIIVHGDGTSFWSSCHRDDVARAFVAAAGNQDTLGKAYHATAEEWMTWDRYHQNVAQAIGAPPPNLVHIPTDLLGRAVPKAAEWCVVNFHFNNIFDNTAARTDLGFRYTIPFVEGIGRTIHWLDEGGRIESSNAHPFYDRILSAWQELGAAMTRELAGIDS
jgi:nucleoside-diphosphate-sugar epimerase